MYELPKDWCYACCKSEPIDSDNPPYLICGECYHLFQTEDDLLTAYNSAWDDEYLKATEASKIYSCPMCSHDF